MVLTAQITPSVDSAVFYFGVNALHFSEHFYGTILLVDGCAQILGNLNLLLLHLTFYWQLRWSTCAVCCHAGVAVYKLFLRKVPLKQVFFWTAIALISAHLMQVLLVTGEQPFSFPCHILAVTWGVVAGVQMPMTEEWG